MKASQAPAKPVPTGLELVRKPANQVDTGQHAVVPKSLSGESSYNAFLRKLRGDFEQWQDELLPNLKLPKADATFNHVCEAVGDAKIRAMQSLTYDTRLGLLPSFRDSRVRDAAMAIMTHTKVRPGAHKRDGDAYFDEETYGLIDESLFEAKVPSGYLPCLVDLPFDMTPYSHDQHERSFGTRFPLHSRVKASHGLDGVDRWMWASAVYLAKSEGQEVDRRTCTILDADPSLDIERKNIPFASFTGNRVAFDLEKDRRNNELLFRLAAKGNLIR